MYFSKFSCVGMPPDSLEREHALEHESSSSCASCAIQSIHNSYNQPILTRFCREFQLPGIALGALSASALPKRLQANDNYHS